MRTKRRRRQMTQSFNQYSGNETKIGAKISQINSSRVFVLSSFSFRNLSDISLQTLHQGNLEYCNYLNYKLDFVSLFLSCKFENVAAHIGSDIAQLLVAMFFPLNGL